MYMLQAIKASIHRRALLKPTAASRETGDRVAGPRLTQSLGILQFNRTSHLLHEIRSQYGGLNMLCPGYGTIRR